MENSDNNTNIKTDDKSNSNNSSNDIFKNETSTKNSIVNLQNTNTPTNNNDVLIDIDTNKPITDQSSNVSRGYWFLYLIVIGISIYFIFQNSDPLNIGFTCLGCGVTLFLLHKTLSRKIYKLEDDDDGINLIEGHSSK